MEVLESSTSAGTTEKCHRRAAARCDWRPFRLGRWNAGEPIRWHDNNLLSKEHMRILQDMAHQGIAVLDRVFNSDDAQAARLEFRSLFERFGKQTYSDTHLAGIRTDYCHGLDEHQARALGLPQLSLAIRTLKSIGFALAQMHSLEGITAAPAAQLAIFPGNGTNYGRHGDNMHAPSSREAAPTGYSNWRVFTVILYVNRGWVPADGGCLRIYGSCSGNEAPLPTETVRETERFRDIEPLAGRVVCFNSLLHHEVLPVHGLRCAVTCWFWVEDSNRDKFRLS